MNTLWRALAPAMNGSPSPRHSAPAGSALASGSASDGDRVPDWRAFLLRSAASSTTTGCPPPGPPPARACGSNR
eukprot:11163013-Lingulodinium_polyedra.AAC.1